MVQYDAEGNETWFEIIGSDTFKIKEAPKEFQGITEPEAKPKIPNEIKIPTTVNEAKSLWVFVSGIVTWLFTGVLSKHKPKWLNNFALSIGSAFVVTGIAYLGSKGQFSITETFEFFVLAISIIDWL